MMLFPPMEEPQATTSTPNSEPFALTKVSTYNTVFFASSRLPSSVPGLSQSPTNKRTIAVRNLSLNFLSLVD